MSETQWETLEVQEVFGLLLASESDFQDVALAFEPGENDVLE